VKINIALCLPGEGSRPLFFLFVLPEKGFSVPEKKPKSIAANESLQP